MKNFQKLFENINTLPILHSLALKPDLWNENTLRTTHALTPHKQVDDIWLRFNSMNDPIVVVDDTKCINYRAFDAMPSIRPILFDLMRFTEAEQLGRVIISRMKPGASIEPHEDAGAAAVYYDRYQFAIQSNPGVMFNCGDEQVNMRTGEIWWFNNRITHSVINNSDQDRIAMIIDIRRCQ